MSTSKSTARRVKSGGLSATPTTVPVTQMGMCRTMCMIDDCEPWEFHNEGRRRAAKEHRCGECRRTIAPGETYEYGSGKCDGYFSQWKTCLHCLEASRWLSAACNGYLIGAVDEDLRHHIRGGADDCNQIGSKVMTGIPVRFHVPEDDHRG